jgi:hypothetical protein
MNYVSLKLDLMSHRPSKETNTSIHTALPFRDAFIHGFDAYLVDSEGGQHKIHLSIIQIHRQYTQCREESCEIRLFCKLIPGERTQGVRPGNYWFTFNLASYPITETDQLPPEMFEEGIEG